LKFAISKQFLVKKFRMLQTFAWKQAVPAGAFQIICPISTKRETTARVDIEGVKSYEIRPMDDVPSFHGTASTSLSLSASLTRLPQESRFPTGTGPKRHQGQLLAHMSAKFGAIGRTQVTGTLLEELSRIRLDFCSVNGEKVTPGINSWGQQLDWTLCFEAIARVDTATELYDV
jgi:hypothetical protein